MFSSVKLFRAAARQQVRTFAAPSKASQQGIVKDLFLKEIKGYKPAAVSAADASSVKDFKLPTPPQAPKFDEDIAAELAAYEQAPQPSA